MGDSLGGGPNGLIGPVDFIHDQEEGGSNGINISNLGAEDENNSDSILNSHRRSRS